MPTVDVSIALNRFGLGARGDDAPPVDPHAWLTSQFARYEPRPTVIAALPPRRELASDLTDYLQQARLLRQQRAAAPAPLRLPSSPSAMDAMAGPSMTGGATVPGTGGGAPVGVVRPAADPNDPVARAVAFARQQGRAHYANAVGARTEAALTSSATFVERMVHFWANHFAVSADKFTIIGLCGNFEFEAIRPHVLGSFRDMLSAAERHPAMLLYLDQAQSIGPSSQIGSAVAARGTRRVGLNENFAREIMELHTLGVRTGYDQADVTEFARALTGWTVQGLGRGIGSRLTGTDGVPGDFTFADRLHEPGSRTILGKRYAEGGEDQAQAVLDDLAVHPATAQHVATKLASHFAGDIPPAALVARLRHAFLASRGDLPSLYRVLIASPETWVLQSVKFKTPWEWAVSAMRALNYRTAPPLVVTGLLNQLGQPAWRPGSPAGYDDMAASWAAPDAVLRRVEAAERFATRAGSATDARTLAPRLFPANLSSATAQALTRAESPGQAISLLLVSPEMMRR